MADFCHLCSIDMFGKDFGDLAGISTLAETRADRYALVICEDCGAIQVDHLGNCISHGCLKDHGASYDRAAVLAAEDDEGASTP